MNPDVSFTEEYSFRHLNGTMVNKIDKKVTYFLGVVDAPHTTAWNAHDEEVMNGAWMDFDEAEKTITFKEARTVLAEVKSHLDKQG